MSFTLKNIEKCIVTLHSLGYPNREITLNELAEKTDFTKTDQGN